MRRHRSALCVALALAVACLTAEGQDTVPWRPGTSIDPESLDEVTAAVGENEDGYRLDFYRHGGDRIVGAFSLPPRDPDILAAGQRPVLTIDGGPAHELVRLSGELKSVGFLVWGGPGQPLRGPLRDLMNGSRVVVQYRLNGGGYKETVFELQGAKRTFAEVLAIPEEVDAGELALAVGREKALEKCFAIEKKKQRQRCMDRLGECWAATPASEDELASCLQAK